MTRTKPAKLLFYMSIIKLAALAWISQLFGKQPLGDLDGRN